MEIGVPTRFSTPRADIDVVTRAARAPALLTAYKVDAAGERLQVDLHLQTGVRTALRHTLASVAEGPFRSCYTANGATTKTLLPAVPGVSYFLHAYQISVGNTAATAGTLGFISWDDYLDGPGDSNGQVNVFIVPSVANVVTTSGVLDVLTRPGGAVTWDTDTLANDYVTLTYAVVSGVM